MTEENGSASGSASNGAAILQELTTFKRFCTWRRVQRGNGFTKRPNQSTLRPSEWLRWPEVAELPCSADGGIGFVLTGARALSVRTAASGGIEGVEGVERQGLPLIAIDLDACVDPATGQLSDWVLPILGRVKSSTEVTVSRTGLRIWCWA